LQVPVTSQVFDAPGNALVYCGRQPGPQASALRARGVDVIERPSSDGRVDLRAVLTDLAHRGVNELHVEAGERLNAALIAAELVDEYLIYVAPRLIGPGRSVAALAPLDKLANALALRFVSVAPCGDDLRIIARPPQRERTLD
jgi:diaminohydroxyphosphoribosylaminopyrimidine deaminase/5-amino-6-(5-phosphoribosylamino)uracil reductase